ncbi:sigma factor-like helix-turn-helix DNA-binding protein [Nocardia sp. NBC_00511]|uniref:sigma-70 region 4 domain-containing protein n=1 Tax=Nocardia sp. NBC_00511 TaxID=2903591 RepID=UPI0030E2A5DD
MGNVAVPSGYVDVAVLPARDARDYLTAALDHLRKTEQSVWIDKRRYMLLAREHGFTNARIGELLDISEAAVRAAIKRAKCSPTYGLDE